MRTPFVTVFVLGTPVGKRDSGAGHSAITTQPSARGTTGQSSYHLCVHYSTELIPSTSVYCPTAHRGTSIFAPFICIYAQESFDRLLTFSNGHASSIPRSGYICTLSGDHTDTDTDTLTHTRSSLFIIGPAVEIVIGCKS